MPEKNKGCTHLIIKKGKIVNVITHLDKLPANGVVHLKADKVYTFDEFKKSHKYDHSELKIKKRGVIISDF